jgi:hypothetical protein
MDGDVKMSEFLSVTLYERPDGRSRQVEMRNIEPEDIHFFESNRLKVSIEELTTGELVVYACPYNDYSEESEVMVLSGSRSCKETMKDLRTYCEEAFNL